MAQPHPIKTDVVIAGAGAAGLTLALALAGTGMQVVLAGPDDPPAAGRTVALLDGSVGFLASIGLWERLRPHAEPLEIMRLVEATGSLFTQPPVEFRAAEIGLPAFGYNIPNAAVLSELAGAVDQHAGVLRLRRRLSSIAVANDLITAICDDGAQVSAPLIVGADGRNSPTRAAARIAARTWTYPQTALTAILSHQQPHRNASTEFHTREGPCTLVPLPPLGDGRPRSSLVWMMSPTRANRLSQASDAEFARAVEAQTQALLGAFQVESGRAVLPMRGLLAASMVGQRTALVGEAGHAFPPIGAQGLNLGLRDVAGLAGCLAGAWRGKRDLGGAATLAAYDRGRRFDIQSRTFGVDLLNRSLLAPLFPIDFLRGAGLAALAHVGPLRRLAMRAGLAQAGAAGF